MAGAWTFTRPTPQPAPSSWPATYTSSCGARWNRFMEMTTRRLRPRSRSRIGWWKRSSSMAPWPTTGSRRLHDCSSKPPTAGGWAPRPRRYPARPSPSAEPAFSSTDDVMSRSRARSHGKSRAPIESISCARSCVTRGYDCSGPSWKRGHAPVRSFGSSRASTPARPRGVPSMH